MNPLQIAFLDVPWVSFSVVRAKCDSLPVEIIGSRRSALFIFGFLPFSNQLFSPLRFHEDEPLVLCARVAHGCSLVVHRTEPSNNAFNMSASHLGWTRDATGRMTRAEDGAAASQADQCLLLELPSHLLREVFGFLDAKDVARAATTCNTFRQVSRSESLWRALLADKLGTQAEIVLPTSLPDER